MDQSTLSSAMALPVTRLYFVLAPRWTLCRCPQAFTRQLQVPARPSWSGPSLRQLEGGPQYTWTARQLTQNSFQGVNYSTRQRVLLLAYRRRYSNGSSKQSGGGEGKTNTATSQGGGTSPAKAASSTERIKVILREYGTVGVVFHISMSLCTLGTCYLLVSK